MRVPRLLCEEEEPSQNYAVLPTGAKTTKDAKNAFDLYNILTNSSQSSRKNIDQSTLSLPSKNSPKNMRRHVDSLKIDFHSGERIDSLQVPDNFENTTTITFNFPSPSSNVYCTKTSRTEAKNPRHPLSKGCLYRIEGQGYNVTKKRLIGPRDHISIVQPLIIAHTVPFKLEIMVYAQDIKYEMHKIYLEVQVLRNYKIDEALVLERLITLKKATGKWTCRFAPIEHSNGPVEIECFIIEKRIDKVLDKQNKLIWRKQIRQKEDFSARTPTTKSQLLRKSDWKSISSLTQTEDYISGLRRSLGVDGQQSYDNEALQSSRQNVVRSSRTFGTTEETDWDARSHPLENNTSRYTQKPRKYSLDWKRMQENNNESESIFQQLQIEHEKLLERMIEINDIPPTTTEEFIRRYQQSLEEPIHSARRKSVKGTPPCNQKQARGKILSSPEVKTPPKNSSLSMKSPRDSVRKSPLLKSPSSRNRSPISPNISPGDGSLHTYTPLPDLSPSITSSTPSTPLTPNYKNSPRKINNKQTTPNSLYEPKKSVNPREFSDLRKGSKQALQSSLRHSRQLSAQGELGSRIGWSPQVAFNLKENDNGSSPSVDQSKKVSSNREVIPKDSNTHINASPTLHFYKSLPGDDSKQHENPSRMEELTEDSKNNFDKNLQFIKEEGNYSSKQSKHDENKSPSNVDEVDENIVVKVDVEDIVNTEDSEDVYAGYQDWKLKQWGSSSFLETPTESTLPSTFSEDEEAIQYSSSFTSQNARDATVQNPSNDLDLFKEWQRLANEFENATQEDLFQEEFTRLDTPLDLTHG